MNVYTKPYLLSKTNNFLIPVNNQHYILIEQQNKTFSLPIAIIDIVGIVGTPILVVIEGHARFGYVTNFGSLLFRDFPFVQEAFVWGKSIWFCFAFDFRMCK